MSYNPRPPSGGRPDNISYQDYDAGINTMKEFWAASAGFEREKLEAEIKSASAGRANAYKIAQLQGEISKYGINAQRQTAMAQLKENARQFDATHALDLQRFGLDVRKFGVDYASAYTEFASSPDRFAQATDFRQMGGRAMQGLGPQPYGTDTTFTPKTEADFAVLAGGPMPNGTNLGGSDPIGANLAPHPAVTAAQGAHANGASGEAKDPRVGVLTSMVKAIPPSAGSGMDESDFAVMKAAEALYGTNLRPGTLQKMRPDQQAIYGSYIKRSGRSLPDYLANYERSAPHQTSVRSY